MKTFRCTYTGRDGEPHTESIPACDPAAALGILLDEQDVDERRDIRVSAARRRSTTVAGLRSPPSGDRPK